MRNDFWNDILPYRYVYNTGQYVARPLSQVAHFCFQLVVLNKVDRKKAKSAESAQAALGRRVVFALQTLH